MNANEGTQSCTKRCWLIAIVGGFLTLILLMALGGWSFFPALLLGAIVAVVGGFILTRLLCQSVPEPVAHSAPAPAPTPAPAPAPEPTPAPEPAPEAAAPAAAAPSEDVVAAAEEDAPSPVAEIKPTTALAGEAELAARKGTWRYEPDTPAAAPAPAAPAAPAPDPAPAAAADGAGTEPQGLSAARDGGADNLKSIKGVGPKLEQKLNAMGFYHFDQIANWSADEVAWVDQNLVGFKGRVTRDNWVEQAKTLAAGGETEFSKKVDKGDVY